MITSFIQSLEKEFHFLIAIYLLVATNCYAIIIRF